MNYAAAVTRFIPDTRTNISTQVEQAIANGNDPYHILEYILSQYLDFIHEIEILEANTSYTDTVWLITGHLKEAKRALGCIQCALANAILHPAVLVFDTQIADNWQNDVNAHLDNCWHNIVEARQNNVINIDH